MTILLCYLPFASTSSFAALVNHYLHLTAFRIVLIYLCLIHSNGIPQSQYLLILISATKSVLCVVCLVLVHHTPCPLTGQSFSEVPSCVFNVTVNILLTYTASRRTYTQACAFGRDAQSVHDDGLKYSSNLILVHEPSNVRRNCPFLVFLCAFNMSLLPFDIIAFYFIYSSYCYCSPSFHSSPSC